MASKTHTIYVRGVSKEIKNSLKRLAKKATGSSTINGYLLTVFHQMTEKEVSQFNEPKK